MQTSPQHQDSKSPMILFWPECKTQCNTCHKYLESDKHGSSRDEQSGKCALQARQNCSVSYFLRQCVLDSLCRFSKRSNRSAAPSYSGRIPAAETLSGNSSVGSTGYNGDSNWHWRANLVFYMCLPILRGVSTPKPGTFHSISIKGR